MDTAYQLVAIGTGLLSAAVMVWYIAHVHGAELRAWFWSVWGPVIERQRELAQLRRMWDA